MGIVACRALHCYRANHVDTGIAHDFVGLRDQYKWRNWRYLFLGHELWNLSHVFYCSRWHILYDGTKLGTAVRCGNWWGFLHLCCGGALIFPTAPSLLWFIGSWLLLGAMFWRFWFRRRSHHVSKHDQRFPECPRFCGSHYLVAQRWWIEIAYGFGEFTVDLLLQKSHLHMIDHVQDTRIISVLAIMAFTAIALCGMVVASKVTLLGFCGLNCLPGVRATFKRQTVDWISVVIQEGWNSKNEASLSHEIDAYYLLPQPDASQCSDRNLGVMSNGRMAHNQWHLLVLQTHRHTSCGIKLFIRIGRLCWSHTRSWSSVFGFSFTKKAWLDMLTSDLSTQVGCQRRSR